MAHPQRPSVLTGFMGTGAVTLALICLCCALVRWSTLLPVWWCCTGLGEAQGVLEVAARDITGVTQTAFDALLFTLMVFV